MEQTSWISSNKKAKQNVEVDSYIETKTWQTYKMMDCWYGTGNGSKKQEAFRAMIGKSG
jgi:hypothetical protein